MGSETEGTDFNSPTTDLRKKVGQKEGVEAESIKL